MGSQEEEIGFEALRKPLGSTKLTYPIERGVITNWEAMQKIWHHAFYSELRIAPEEHPILLTEPLLNPKEKRERTVQDLMGLGVPDVYLAAAPVLPLYPTGRTTGVVVQSGDSLTVAVPVYQTHPVVHAVQRLEMAGRDLTEHLSGLLRERGFTVPTREVVRLKEQCCYVAEHFDKEVQLPPTEVTHRLPDGRTITLGNERFTCPEVLFQPQLSGREARGVHEITFRCIESCREHLEPEDIKDLYSNIVLSGGTTLFKGFSERITREVMSLADSTLTVEVVALPERANSAWAGGAVLANLGVQWITRDEYMAEGPSIVSSRCK